MKLLILYLCNRAAISSKNSAGASATLSCLRSTCTISSMDMNSSSKVEEPVPRTSSSPSSSESFFPLRYFFLVDLVLVSRPYGRESKIMFNKTIRRLHTTKILVYIYLSSSTNFSFARLLSTFFFFIFFLACLFGLSGLHFCIPLVSLRLKVSAGCNNL